MEKINNKSAFERLLKYSQKYRRDYILGTIYSVLNKFFDIAPEILIGVAIDVVVSQKKSFLGNLGVTDPMEQLLYLAGLTLCIWVLESIFEYLYLLRWKNLAQKIQFETRRDLYEHLQSLDLSFHENKQAGSMTSIINDDVNQLERFLNSGANSLIQVITAVILIGGIFFYLSPVIALFSFLPVPIILFGAFYFQTKAQPLYADVREKVGALGAKINANISGITTIKAFTREKYELNIIENLSREYVIANEKAIKLGSAFIPLIRMAILAGFLFTFVMGGHLALKGELNVGLYGVLVFLTQRLLWPFTGLAEVIDSYQRAMASVNRILDVLQTKTDVYEDSLKDKLKNPLGDISFNQLSFSYPDRDQVLTDINFTIRGKSRVAFVGSTGSGKSSLVKLILAFYAPQKGNIRIGDQLLENISHQSLRENIGWVNQDVYLFDGSIIENIRYGNPTASEEQVVACAKKAYLHDFIVSLPLAYNTLVGERGQKLSGGQKQRLALARALIKDPKILILDEATSAVDNETESLIEKSIQEVSLGRTTIVIAHRLSTVTNAEVIFVFERGQIIESGSHKDLLQKNGIYSQLWSLQTRH